MSRRRKKRPGNNPPGKSTGQRRSESNGNSSQPDITRELFELSNEAVRKALEEGIEPQSTEIPQVIQNGDIKQLYKEAQNAKSIFEELSKKHQMLTDEIQQKRDEVAEMERHWQEKQQIQDEREETLNKRDAEITHREADALAGYLAQHQTVLDEVRSRIEVLREAYAGFGSAISDGGVALLDEHRDTVNAFIDAQRETLTTLREDYQRTLDELRNHWEQERQALNEREQQLIEREKTLRSGERKLQSEREIQSEDEEERKALIEEMFELRTLSLQKRIEDLTQLLDELRSQLDQRIEESRQWDSLIQIFKGERDPEAIKQLISGWITDARKNERDRLKSQNFEQIERQLGEQQESVRQLTDERNQLRQEIAMLKRQNHDLQVNAWELEDTQLERAALEKSRTLLQARLEDLQTHIDRMIDDQTQNAQPFEQCSQMDRDTELQSPSNVEAIKDLAKLTREVQTNMERQGFYYEARDVRSFIGGLAMSHLMILQGISGTGKTSLPIQFAQAVGGMCEVIEVQSSWRDREDLIGYYNSFERRFHERAMLTALYQAHCSHNHDRIFIILLDEMNLSYPEQYFADFLSVLERQEISDASLEIVSKHIDQRELPEHLQSDHRGIRLHIPSNVWFVGTANRDETTKDIADKTYDRAHIMELPNRHAEADSKQKNGALEFIPSVGYRSLQSLFNDAANDKKYLQVVDNALSFLNGLRENMAQALPLIWGNRLEKQIQQYIPVVLACGGNEAEAVDHILATRILRKLRDRYDVDAEALQNLQNQIHESWPVTNTELERSKKLLADEIRQKQRSY